VPALRSATPPEITSAAATGRDQDQCHHGHARCALAFTEGNRTCAGRCSCMGHVAAPAPRVYRGDEKEIYGSDFVQSVMVRKRLFLRSAPGGVGLLLPHDWRWSSRLLTGWDVAARSTLSSPRG